MNERVQRPNPLSKPLLDGGARSIVEEEESSGFESPHSPDIIGVLHRNAAVVEFQQAAKDRWRVKKDRQICACSITTLILMIIQNVLIWQLATSDDPRDNGVHVDAEEHPGLFAVMWAIYGFMASLTILCLILLVQYYSVLYKLKKGQLVQALADSRDLTTNTPPSLGSHHQFFSGLFSRFVGEVLVQLIFPYPWLRRTSILYQLLILAMFLRLYIVFRLMHTSSRAFRRRHQIRSQYQDFRRMNLKISWALTIKMAFYKYMWTMVGVFTVLILFVLAFGLYVVERGTVEQDDGSMQVTPFNDLGNCLWFAFVTFTTIGYGDMVPQTHSGRLVTILLGVLGHVVTAAFGGVITNKLTPTKTQQLVTEHLENQDAEASYKNAAALLIQSVWRAKSKRLKQLRKEKKERPSLKGGAASALGKKVKVSKSEQKKRSRHREMVYAAVKRFRSKRYQLAKSTLQAIDPVIDKKLDSLTDSVQQHTDALERILGILDADGSPLATLKTRRASSNNLFSFTFGSGGSGRLSPSFRRTSARRDRSNSLATSNHGSMFSPQVLSGRRKIGKDAKDPQQRESDTPGPQGSFGDLLVPPGGVGSPGIAVAGCFEDESNTCSRQATDQTKLAASDQSGPLTATNPFSTPSNSLNMTVPVAVLLEKERQSLKKTPESPTGNPDIGPELESEGSSEEERRMSKPGLKLALHRLPAPHIASSPRHSKPRKQEVIGAKTPDSARSAPPDSARTIPATGRAEGRPRKKPQALSPLLPVVPHPVVPHHPVVLEESSCSSTSSNMSNPPRPTDKPPGGWSFSPRARLPTTLQDAAEFPQNSPNFLTSASFSAPYPHRNRTSDDDILNSTLGSTLRKKLPANMLDDL